MLEAELIYALNGLHAYDMGAVNSGIKDDLLRDKVRAALCAMPSRNYRSFISRFVTSFYFSESALDRGYGPRDAKDFLVWLDEDLGQ